VERVVLCIVNSFNDGKWSEHCLVFGTVKQLCGLCTAKLGVSGHSPRTVCVLLSIYVVKRVASW